MKRLLSCLLALQFFAINFGVAAQEMGEQPPSRDQGFMQTMIMVSIALVFFYFILWRPEQNRRKEMEEQRDALSKGDRVTAMGIVGTVSKIQEDTVILKMYDGSKIEFLKAAISDVESNQPQVQDAERA